MILLFTATFARLYGKLKTKYMKIIADIKYIKRRTATLLKKRLWQWCFLVNFEKFLRTPLLTEHPWWLLLPNALFSSKISFKTFFQTWNIIARQLLILYPLRKLHWKFDEKLLLQKFLKCLRKFWKYTHGSVIIFWSTCTLFENWCYIG